MAEMMPIVNIHHLSNYKFSATKAAKVEKDASVADRLARMQQTYRREGMRRSVEGVLVVHEHNCPHVIVFQIGDTIYKLPGGRLKPGEDEIEGLRRKLTSKLAVSGTHPHWQIEECVGHWWRPNFEEVMYPYCPPHITKPKELKKLYLVHLSEKQKFHVPRNFKTLAVPIFEFYKYQQRYGPVLASLPAQLSRFQFIRI